SFNCQAFQTGYNADFEAGRFYILARCRLAAKELCMAEDKVEEREVNFRQMLPWTELFRSFQVALDPKKLLLAAAGILVMSLGWYVLAWAAFEMQTKPEWDQYDASKEFAWEKFKDDRAKWNNLWRAAGDGRADYSYQDAGDLADNAKNYEVLKEEIAKD